MDGLNSLTVVELKELLKEKGLPISGKKSELIERLIVNNKGVNLLDEPKSIVIPSAELIEDSDQHLPFLTSLLQNGLSSVHFDRKLALRYGAALIMLIFMISGLNSNSWYYMEWSKTDGDPDMGMYVDEKTTLYFGLSDIEILYEAEGIVWGETVDTEESESFGEYDSAACKPIEEFSCDSFSTAGTWIQTTFWISIFCILLIFGLGIVKGFGKEITPQFHMYEPRIRDISWGLATALPFIGTIIYGFIIGQSEMDLSRLDLDNNGFGFIWWSMLIFSFAFAGLVYSQQISSMISRFKQVLAK